MYMLNPVSHSALLTVQLPQTFQWKDVRDLVKSRLPNIMIVRSKVVAPGVASIVIKGNHDAEALANEFNNYSHPPSGNVLIAYISSPGPSVPPSAMSSPMPGVHTPLVPPPPQLGGHLPAAAGLAPHMQSLSLHSAPSTPLLAHMQPTTGSPMENHHLYRNNMGLPPGTMPDPYMSSPLNFNPHQHPQMAAAHAAAAAAAVAAHGYPGTHFQMAMSPQLQSPEYWMAAAAGGPNPFYPSSAGSASPSSYNMYGGPGGPRPPLGDSRNYNSNGNGRPRGFSVNYNKHNGGGVPQYDNNNSNNNSNFRRRGTYNGAPYFARNGAMASTTHTGEPAYRLFIGNIPYATQWQELKDYLRTAGEIYRVEIPVNADGRAKGYAIATYQSGDTAAAAIEQFHGAEFNGRELTVRFDRYNPTGAASNPMAAGYPIPPPIPPQHGQFYAYTGFPPP